MKITAINLALHNLFGNVIWGNTLVNERKLVYQTGFNGQGVIRLVKPGEMPTLREVEPAPLPPSTESLETRTHEEKPGQGSLFDELE